MIGVLVVFGLLWAIPTVSKPVLAGTNAVKTKVYKNHTYSVYDDASSWEDAKKKCKEKGGHLVTLTSKGEDNFVWSLVRSCGFDSAAIGLYNAGSSNNPHWKWVTGEKVSYTNWQPGEPNGDYGGTEYYGQFFNMSSKEGWNDSRNNDRMNVYICEWDYALKITESQHVLNAKATDWIDYKAVGSSSALNKVNVSFSSSNKNVAKVSSKGKIVAVNPGTCKITCKLGKISKKISVTVKPKKVNDLKVLSKTSTSVRLTWKQQNGISKYIIYMYDKDLEEFTQVKSVDGDFNTATIRKLNRNRSYTFKIRCYVKNGTKKYFSAYSNDLTVKTSK